MKIYLILKYTIFNSACENHAHFFLFHGVKKPEAENEIINFNFFGREKKSPGALVKNVFNKSNVIMPFNRFLVSEEVLSKIKGLKFEKMPINYLLPFSTDIDQQDFIKARYDKKPYSDDEFCSIVAPYKSNEPNAKYYELYFPHFKIIKDNYSNLKEYKFIIEESKPQPFCFEETVELCEKMFVDNDIVSFVGNYFTQKSFDLFWPLLDHEYFFYREFEI